MRWLWVLMMVASCDYVFRLDHVDPPPGLEEGAGVVPGRWTQVAAGQSHTCAIDLAGALFCWGRNDDGETGVGLVQVP